MLRLKKSEIVGMTNEELVSELLWCTIRSTKEINSMRGLTKQTAKEEEWLLGEMAKRFNLDLAVIQEKMKN
ncbi:hypothetical protein P9X10_01170 [Bacillus cereus]|nr:hypothetical protein [Bacillus cereus]